MSRPPKNLLILPGLLTAVLAHCLTAAVFANPATPFTTVLDARSGQPIVLAQEGPYLEFITFDWGPAWSGARRESVVTPAENGASTASTVKLAKSNATYKVNTAWSKVSGETLRCQAQLEADADADLTLSVLGISPDGFAGGALEATLADGTVSKFTFPLGKADIGGTVKSLRLRDAAGKETVVAFDQPVPVVADNDLRIVLARDRITSGMKSAVHFTVTLPGETSLVASADQLPDSQKGWYVFTGESPIPAGSEWRMDSWLDAPAGRHGRIASREDKLFYNNQPVKLWGINVSYGACAPDTALADRRADFYAALGINSVRLHKYADGNGWAGILAPGTAARFDEAALERMDYFVAALKKRGIYSKLSPVFIIKPGEDDLERVPYLKEFPKKGDRYDPRHGALYVSRELQDLLAGQMTSLLTHKNPHTGLTYAEDPAIAYVELYNEDSALFGGVSNALEQSPTLRARTGERFAKWIKAKYPTEEAFKEAWGPQALNNSILENQKIPLDESWAENRIYPAGNPWFFDPANLNTSQAPFKRRLLDTMLFLKELQDETYARLGEAVRATGYQGEILASNWQAGRQMSHFYNLHSDAQIGTIDRHNYFGGGARGGVGPIKAASMLALPGSGSFSAGLQQVGNRPFMLSEWIHVGPNEWGVEGPAILGAYGMGLQGWDVSYPFQNRDAGTFSVSIGPEQWDAAAPQFAGIFPAVSRQVHRGDVQESPVVHTRHVHLPSLDSEKVGFEEKVNQDQDVKTFDSDVFPSAALAVGRGVIDFTDTFTPTPAFDLAAHRGPDGALTSVTKQLRWQPGATNRDGHIEIDTPATQAVVGFANGRKVELADATIAPASRFAAIYLTAKSKDGTISSDKAVLISVIARARNRDQRVVNDVYLARTGADRKASKPGNVFMEPVVADITLKRAGNPTVHILDHNGVRTGRTVPVKNGSFTLDTGRDETPYYLVTW